MTVLIPICPPNRNVLEALREIKVIIRCKSSEQIHEIFALSQQCGVQLHGLIVQSNVSVADFNFVVDHRAIPIAFFAPDLGLFREFVPRLPVLRKLNIKLYLPANRPENLTSLRILSSLGLASVAVFTDVNIDWEDLTDLMTYALLGKVPHAPVEPFQYLADRYSANSRNDYSAVYFNDPTKYVHIDDNGRIALSIEDLSEQFFVSKKLCDLWSLSENIEYQARLEKWRRFFLQPKGCAYCEAWRICLGKFNESCFQNEGCSSFFKEFLGVIEQYTDLKNQNVLPWQR